MFAVGDHAQLHLNGKCVGDVLVQRCEDSWAHGQFAPNETFCEFADTFGRWSLLMHADGRREPLSEAAADELRRVEYEIDHMKAKLVFPDTGVSMRCAQLNIDGELIEWKKY
jgi:hypothetical protein